MPLHMWDPLQWQHNLYSKSTVSSCASCVSDGSGRSSLGSPLRTFNHILGHSLKNYSSRINDPFGGNEGDRISLGMNATICSCLSTPLCGDILWLKFTAVKRFKSSIGEEEWGMSMYVNVYNGGLQEPVLDRPVQHGSVWSAARGD